MVYIKHLMNSVQFYKGENREGSHQHTLKNKQMSHASHQSEGLKVDKGGSAQTAVIQSCIPVGDRTESTPHPS